MVASPRKEMFQSDVSKAQSLDQVFLTSTLATYQTVSQKRSLLFRMQMTHVIVGGTTDEEVLKNTVDCINNHVKTLLNLGMIVNSKKTEAIYFG